MPDKPLILFLHIPKTAGLTIAHSLLPRIYRRNEMVSTKFTSLMQEDGECGVGIVDSKLKSSGLFLGTRRSNDLWYPHSLAKVKETLDRMSPEQLSLLRLVHGAHIVYGLHEILSRPISYFTLLRDPVNRVLSHYYYGGEERLPPGAPGFPEDLPKHVEANLQTRLLAGEQDTEAPLAPEEMLRRAKENLNSCVVIGLTERFDETLLLLKKEYGWPMPYYELRNVNKKRPRREAAHGDVLQRIEADNRLDASLYALAQKLFAAQVERYGPAFQRDLVRFRAGNRRWQRWHRVRVWLVGLPVLIGRATIDPVYNALARWGGLCRLLPSRLVPRVVPVLENGRLFIDLKMGERLVGSFDPRRQRWEIYRPYHLLVNERALPLANGLNATGRERSPE